MDNKSNKTIWIILGVVIVILLVVFLVKPKAKDSMTDDANMNGGDTALEATEDTSAGSVNANGGQAVSISYAKALETYKDRRIQFNDSCTATPNNVTYKDNTGLMLDNRSAKPLTIKIGTTYSVKAYGFKIITLPDTYKQNKTLLVDCNGQQNVATILVQE